MQQAWLSLRPGLVLALLFGTAVGPLAAVADAQDALKERTIAICNAYKAPSLELSYVRTGESMGTMYYKDCRRFRSMVRPGDRIDFSRDGKTIGSFQIREQPKPSPLLLLVVLNSGVPRLEGEPAAFKSHAFSKSASGEAQLVVINAFDGPGHTMSIFDVGAKVAKQDPASSYVPNEDLAFDTASGLTPALYKVTLSDGSPANLLQSIDLDMLANSSYIALRLGGADSHYPEEILFQELMGNAAAAPVTSLFVGVLVALSLAAALRDL